MKLIKPYYEILTEINGESILKDIEKAARTCYKSEDKITEGSAEKLIQKLINRGHHAMLEFGPSITVKFICDRGVSHEIVRHRLASYAQESTRYCNYGNEDHITFIIPNWTGLEEGEYINFSDYTGDLTEAESYYLEALFNSEKAYFNLDVEEWSPQQSRSVLPNSLKTEINVKMNIREWRHFFKMRASKAAHPQMQELARPLLEEFKNKIPILFNDLGNE